METEPNTNKQGFYCAACGHQHTGRQWAFICVGCPCPERRPPFEMGDSTGSAGDYEQQAVQETVAAGPVDTPAVESPSSREPSMTICGDGNGVIKIAPCGCLVYRDGTLCATVCTPHQLALNRIRELQRALQNSVAAQ